MSQHKNYGISEMHKFFCTKFCPFVYKTTVHNFAALCCIYLTYAKLTQTQTSRTNFATVQTVQKAALLLMLSSAQYHLCCDVTVMQA